MKLLPMKATKEIKSERMASFLCGVPSLTLGVGGMILILSFVGGVPIGATQFYNIELVSNDAKDALGKPILMKPSAYIVPSTLMLWTLWLGACCGGLGMYLTRVRWPNRSAQFSASGLIACSVAFALSWLIYARMFR